MAGMLTGSWVRTHTTLRGATDGPTGSPGPRRTGRSGGRPGGRMPTPNPCGGPRQACQRSRSWMPWKRLTVSLIGIATVLVTGAATVLVTASPTQERATRPYLALGDSVVFGSSSKLASSTSTRTTSLGTRTTSARLCGWTRSTPPVRGRPPAGSFRPPARTTTAVTSSRKPPCMSPTQGPSLTSRRPSSRHIATPGW
jgi:hypothetical protein